MNFSLLVLSSPYSTQGGETAWQFASAAVDGGHSIYRVFFYYEGAYHGNQLSVAPQDEVDRVQRWAQFAEQHKVDLVLCVASSVKRGMLDDSEALRHERASASIHPAFELSGLGQLVDAGIKSDRLVTFGS